MFEIPEEHKKQIHDFFTDMRILEQQVKVRTHGSHILLKTREVEEAWARVKPILEQAVKEGLDRHSSR